MRFSTPSSGPEISGIIEKLRGGSQKELNTALSAYYMCVDNCIKLQVQRVGTGAKKICDSQGFQISNCLYFYT